MAVDKTLEIVYDLTSLNQEQANKLIEANEEIIKTAEQQKKKSKTKTKNKDLNTQQVIEEFPIDAVTGDRGINIFVDQFKSAIPFITPILLTAGFFITKLLALDKLNKKFIDIADTRISAFIGRQQQALLDSRQTQTNYTTTPGTAPPRDSYNSFNDFDRSIINDGVDKDAAAIRGID